METLKRTSFGGRLLYAIGGVYVSCAEMFFAKLSGHFSLESQMAEWRQSARSTMVHVAAASSVAKSVFAAKRFYDCADNFWESGKLGRPKGAEVEPATDSASPANGAAPTRGADPTVERNREEDEETVNKMRSSL